MRYLFNIIFLFCLSISNSFSLEFKGKFEQGSFILGKTKPEAKVFIDNKQIRVSKDGFFAFGLDRDRKNNVLVKIIINKEIKELEKVLKRDYMIQRIDGLPPKQVTPPPEVYEKIKKDNFLIGKARKIDSDIDFLEMNSYIQSINTLLQVYMAAKEYLTVNLEDLIME